MSAPPTGCQQPDCEGSYEDFGDDEQYCDVCGFPPPVSGLGALGSPATGVVAEATGRTGSSGSTGTGPGSSSHRSVSGRLSGSSSGAGSVPAVSARGSRSTTDGSSSARKRLGAGLVTVPEVPAPVPTTEVMADPEVPERKRFCSNGECGSSVGRSRKGRPGRTEGFCTKCGQPYSFTPKLNRGDVINGQYEIAGCLAHGGLGWIYLAIDRPLNGRWVVLKGLLDTADQDAMAVAISERRFLSEIEHSSIVRVYNFVEHHDPRTGSVDGYIVMEYIGGKSLKQLANERLTPEGRREPLPVEQACAYGIDALEALGYLHSRGLLYCDFKVDNAIQQNHQLKLIDMGAVRRMDDDDSAIYGTVGYQAPEVAEQGASVASDLYTVARTLAVLTFDFQGFTTVYRDSLPPPESIGIFQQYESFYRLLARATDPDPGRRFASAEEMADQLTGVLREVVALQTGKPRPTASRLFGPEVRLVDTDLLSPPRGDASTLGSRVQRSRRRFGWRRADRPQAAQAPAALSPGGAASAGPVTGALPAERTGSLPGSAERPAIPAGGVPAQSPEPATGAEVSGRRAGQSGGDGDRQTGAAGEQALAPAEHPPGAPESAAPPAAAPGAVAPGTVTHGTVAPGTAEDPATYSYGQTPAHVRLPHQLRASSPAVREPVAGAPSLVPLRIHATALALPVPRIDMRDPSATFVLGLLNAEPHDVLPALEEVPVESLEVRLRRLRARLELADRDPESATAVNEIMAALESEHGEDWRVVWYRGLVALTRGDRDTSAHSFDAVYDAFPGEPAPKLALAVCAEMLGQLDNAAEYYRLVWSANRNYVSSAFGWARVLLASGDRPGAVAALESVPQTSIHYLSARVAAVAARLRERDPHDDLLPDLYAAAEQVEQLDALGVDAPRRERLTTEVLGSALDWVLAGRHGAPANPGPGQIRSVLGCPLEEEGLRLGLEKSCRTLARLATSGTERIEWVERANRFRPRTWV
ncbi:serine/threonine-protein kinase PknG [Streptomyces sp. XM4193]|uniref:serine/threonine-protein kinase n=1 Tax=Streptomyces sp. XM4193 TaxID=2929782 RepID=UPI001FF7393B|nr:serine/threonine-protein kinase [Streptomyces sp. XM4193]MCK1795811.1 serine/threonine-protein kinase PknG [Streptomyces sp. XM4193]